MTCIPNWEIIFVCTLFLGIGGVAGSFLTWLTMEDRVRDLKTKLMFYQARAIEPKNEYEPDVFKMVGDVSLVEVESLQILIEKSWVANETDEEKKVVRVRVWGDPTTDVIPRDQMEVTID